MAEFWRALRTLKALQAEQALASSPDGRAWRRPRSGPRFVPRWPAAPNRTNPSAAPHRHLNLTQYALPEPPASGALHEPAAPWRPNEPERSADARLEAAGAGSPMTAAGGSPVGRCTCQPPAIASDHAGDDRPGAATRPAVRRHRRDREADGNPSAL